MIRVALLDKKTVLTTLTIFLFRVGNTEIDDIAMIVFNFTKQSIQSWAG